MSMCDSKVKDSPRDFPNSATKRTKVSLAATAYPNPPHIYLYFTCLAAALSANMNPRLLLVLALLHCSSSYKAFVCGYAHNRFFTPRISRGRHTAILDSHSLSYFFAISRARLYSGVRSSDDDEYSRALEIAKKYDSEWLSKILDATAIPGSSSKEEPEVRQDPVRMSSKAVYSEGAMDPSDKSELIALGYSDADVRAIKPKVKEIIVSKAVRRPKTLPSDWIMSPSTTAKPKESAYQEVPIAPRRKKSARVDSAESDDEDDEELVDEESAREQKRRFVTDKTARKSARRESPERGVSPSFQVDDDGTPSFWPDSDEFKDMLLDESKWRIDILGPWVAPMVREETKWRYSVYKRWLQFLDEGLGDGFDVLPNDFDEDDDDEGDDDDEPKDDDNAAARKSKVRRQSTAVGSAAKYSDWLSREISASDGWEELSTVQPQGKARRRKTAAPNVSNREEWFEEKDAAEVDGRTVTRAPKRVASELDRYDDFDEV